MSNLTEIRFKKAKPILEKYRTKLHAAGTIIDPGLLERELLECLGFGPAGYKSLEGIFKQLAEIARYRYLAASYMDQPFQASGFHKVLAKLYGVKYYDSPDLERKKKAFWAKLKTQK